MKIEEIQLHNFRQFSGDTIVKFSTDTQQNITVIHAMNGSGKTTFLQAFYWTLYGKLKLPNSNRLLNENIFANMNADESKEVFVEITATHEGAIYSIKRSLEVKKDSYGGMKNSKVTLNVTYTEESGKSKVIDDDMKAQNKINSIIPEKLASYFFFDGERIESLGENTAKARKDIANGIKNILNISTYDELQNVLEKKVITLFQNDMISDNKDKLNSMIDKKNDINETIDKYKHQKKTIEEINEELDKKIDELNNIIMQNQSAMEHQIKLIKNKKEMDEIEKDINDIIFSKKGTKMETLPKAYTKLSLYRLLNKLKDSVELNLNIANVKNNEYITGVNIEAVDQILDRKICICGRRIGNDEKIILENLRQYLPPNDQNALIYGYNQRYLEKIKSLNESSQIKENLIEKYFKLKEKMDNLDEDNKLLNKKLDSVQEIESINLEKRKKESKKEFNIKAIGSIESKLEDLEKKLSSIEVDIQKYTEYDRNNEKVKKRIDFVKNIINILDYNIEKKKKEVHDKLTIEVNNIFGSVSHKNTKEVIIDDDYSYKIRDKITKHEALSEGEAIITSLSFIAAIIKIAKDLEEQKKSEVGEGVEYPLVLDAPFAKLDSIHINGIAPILPEFADQVILLTIDQQFKNITNKKVSESIGIEYEMQNSMDKEVIIERIK